MKTKFFLLSLIFGLMFLGGCEDDTPPPTIEIDSVSLECLPYIMIPRTFFIKGSATLYPQGNVVKEAGFLSDAYTSNPKLLVYDFGPLTNYRVFPCKITGNQISFDEMRTDIVGSQGFSTSVGRAYFRAYMILEDGTRVYSDIIEVNQVVRE